MDAELHAFGADQALVQYSRAAKEPWNFCNLGEPGIHSERQREQPAVDS